MTQRPLATMPIKVKVEGKNRALSLAKGEGAWDRYYEIEVTVENGRQLRPAVSIDWSRQAFFRPVRLQLECNEPITAIGFSECRNGIEPYDRVGPCGGCFFLWTDLTDGGQKTVFVDNWGHSREDGYHFALWFGDADRGPIDPQIYNEGVIRDPEEGRRRRDVLRWLFWRLVEWLRGRERF